MGDYINKFRFLIPPSVFLVTVFIFNSEWLNKISCFLSKYNHVSDIVTIFGGSFLVLSVGFVISSFASMLITIGGWAVSKEERDSYGHKWCNFFSEKNITGLSKKEFNQWKDLNSENFKYLRSQIEKRWQMFTVNVNMTISLFLSLICILFSDVFIKGFSTKDFWLLLPVILMLFFYSFSKALYLSTIKLHEKLREKKFYESFNESTHNK